MSDSSGSTTRDTAAPRLCRIVWCRRPAEDGRDYCIAHVARERARD